MESYVLAMMGSPDSVRPLGTFIAGFGPEGLVDKVLSRQQYLAFDARNVDRSITAGSPDLRLEVIQGRFSPEATDNALKECRECPPLQELEHRGVKFYSWGDSDKSNIDKIFAPPAFDSIGRGSPIAVLEEYVFRAIRIKALKLLIDASLGLVPTLADEEEFWLLAQAMHRLGAYSALFSNQTQGLEATLEGFDEQDRSHVRSLLETTPILRPYLDLGTGVAEDRDGPYMVVVLVHSEEGAAKENVTLLRRRLEEASSLLTPQPWSEFFDAARVEVRSEGRVLQAKLPILRSPNIWLEFFFQRDPLLLHE